MTSFQRVSVRVALVMMLSLSACSDDDDNGTTSETAALTVAMEVPA